MRGTNNNTRLFCGRFDIEKGMSVLFFADVFGMILYVINLIGVIVG